MKLGRVYRIKESDVNKFIDERMTQPAKKESPPETIEKVEKVIPQEKPTNDPNSSDHYYII